MNEFNPAEMKRELADALVKTGIPVEEAKELASKQIDSLGAVKTMTGQCPLGGANPLACMFCPYGHMTHCHYPHTCEEAQCSHYQVDEEGIGNESASKLLY